MSMPGFWELAMLAILGLLIFGPDKLPGMARSLGRTLGNFRREAQSALDELKRAAEVEELRKVGAELKETAQELERQTAEAAAAAEGPGRGAGPAAADRAAADRAAQAPPPFDPDAT